MTFTAKYDGRCAECQETIYRGDQLQMIDGQAVHADCTPDDRSEPPARPTCPTCWLEISTSGACGCDEDGGRA